MDDFTIILPHLRNPGNDRALSIAIDMLMANTTNDFTLLIEAVRGGSLYDTVNAMVRATTTEAFVYWSSDMFPAVGWDEPMIALYTPDTIVTNVLVEPGAIGMHGNNVHKDFGRTPERFRRADFEAYATSPDAHYNPDNHGWFAPYLMSREGFLEVGGLQSGLPGDHHGFSGADELMFAEWQAAGKSIKRARSFVFHLQRWSQQDEQEHEKRGHQA